MVNKFGLEWLALARAEGNRGAVLETQAVEEILWWAVENEWFKYPFGSTLLYFQFPSCYRSQALEGVRVYYLMRDLLQNGDNPQWERRRTSLAQENLTIHQQKVHRAHPRKI